MVGALAIQAGVTDDQKIDQHFFKIPTLKPRKSSISVLYILKYQNTNTFSMWAYSKNTK